MALFQEKPKPKSKPAGEVTNKKSERIIDKIRLRAAKAAKSWLRDQFGSYSRGYETEYDENKVDQWVSDVLNEVFEGAILRAVGIEKESFNQGYRVKYDSILLAKIREVAKKQAEDLLDKYIKKHARTLPGSLPKKYLDAVEKSFEEAYVGALGDAAAMLAKDKAKEDVNKILKDLLQFPEKVYEKVAPDIEV